MVKDDWPPSPSWLPRISPEILKFRFSVHMVKVNDDGPPDPWLSKISLEILKFRFSLYMAKMFDPPLLLDCPAFYQKFKSLDLVCIWSRSMMLDPPLLLDCPGFYLKFWSLDLVCTWSKMIDPPLLLDCPGFYQKFWSLDLVCTWLKMIDPPAPWLHRILAEMLKFRFSVHMVKDDWPPCHLTAQDFTRNFKV